MFRKDLIPLLLNNPLSVTRIARVVVASPRDIEADVQHFLKSLRHTEYSVVITPAECRKCGFAFGTDKLRKPSKCPECQSTWLVEPTIEVREKTPGPQVSPPAATSDDRRHPKK
jgi:predicted Zn-ribbon and HTH transcriptional regulator